MCQPNKINKISLLVFILITCLTHAQQVFTYNTFLRSVLESNPLSKKAYNNKIYGKLQQKAAKGGFDPQLSAAFESKQFNSSNYFTVGNAELKQPLYTSQYLKIGYQYGQGLFMNPEQLTSSYGLPYVGLEASLLQGLAFDKRRAEVIKAKHYADYFNAEQKIQLNELMLIASNVYADVLYTKKINSLYSYFSNLATQRLKGISELSVAGERPTIDTIEAAIFLQGRVLDKQSGEITLITKLNELSVLSPDIPTMTEFAISDSLEEVYSLTLKLIQQKMVNEQTINPVLLQYEAKQKVLETEKKLKREMIKPVLDLNYNFLSNSNTPVYTSLNPNNYKWGATFSLPLFLRKSVNEYKMADLLVKNNSLEISNKQNQISYKRKYILDAVKVIAGQITNAERSSVYSKQLVEAERLKFINGESSLFLLNARESKWLETELKLAEYKLKFIKAYIELTYINGDLNYEL